MTDSKRDALEKRIKRRVTAREHTFFVTVSPGLVDICRGEMERLFPDKKEIRTVDGGIEFTGKVADCYRTNLHLRTASRILMRLGSFKATSFRELEKKVAAFPWELYLKNGPLPEIHVSLKKSRLYHKEAVAVRIEKILGSCFPEMGEKSSGTASGEMGQALFIRAVEDRFTISLDSSGELLYRRGIKTHGGRAPMRETLAAAALIHAGYDGRMPLVDPMCGSGTFSLEAAMIAMNMPAGWFREFAFTGWPCFSSGIWKHIRREAEKKIRPGEKGLVFASDMDAKALSSLEKSILNTEFAGIIQVAQNDFFKLEPLSLTEEKGLVIINPPYGLRIGTVKESGEMVPRIMTRFNNRYRGWKAAVISTRKPSSKKLPKGFKSLPFFHGGLKLFLIFGQIR